MEKIDILRRTDIFYDLTAAQLEMLASICEERVVKLGDVIFEENSQGDEMFVIARGAVEILVDPSIVGGPGAKKRGSMPVTIATLRSGQTFGEIVLVDQGLRTASARCAETETCAAGRPSARSCWSIRACARPRRAAPKPRRSCWQFNAASS
jgi:CRP/FNR family transcriptional regulator, cyclic AMP receptor protein